MTTFIIHAESTPGILFRVATVFLRRGINIETLHAEDGAIEISVRVDTGREQLLAAQLRKIIGVSDVRCDFT